jgi:hypothetical protein
MRWGGRGGGSSGVRGNEGRKIVIRAVESEIADSATPPRPPLPVYIQTRLRQTLLNI